MRGIGIVALLIAFAAPACRSPPLVDRALAVRPGDLAQRTAYGGHGWNAPDTDVLRALAPLVEDVPFDAARDALVRIDDSLGELLGLALSEVSTSEHDGIYVLWVKARSGSPVSASGRKLLLGFRARDGNGAVMEWYGFGEIGRGGTLTARTLTSFRASR